MISAVSAVYQSLYLLTINSESLQDAVPKLLNVLFLFLTHAVAYMTVPIVVAQDFIFLFKGLYS